jgi:hypothetical protein
MRWDNYFCVSGPDVELFWRGLLSNRDRKLLFICGLGFDPRMNDGLSVLASAEGAEASDCILVRYEEGADSPSHEYVEYVRENELRFRELCGDRFSVNERTISIWSSDGRTIGSRQASQLLPDDPTPLAAYSDIVLDPSALPRTVYLTLLAKLLFLLDAMKASTGGSPNLHVLLSDSTEIDNRIHEIEPNEDVSFLHGFSGGINHSASSDRPRVWFPLLGEGCGPQLIRIHNRINPDEICPVLPSPSSNPRRGDNLLREHREVLFDRFLLDSGNVIYASEHNPFEVYRQLHAAILHYSDALSTLGGSKSIVSNLSSKLASVGALLACYELKAAGREIGIAHVEAHGYEASSLERHKDDSTLFSLWIGGEPYA